MRLMRSARRRGDEEDEHELPELGGLEAEERDVDPAAESTGDGADELHEHHQADHHAVETGFHRLYQAGSMKIAPTISTTPTPANTSWRVR